MEWLRKKLLWLLWSGPPVEFKPGTTPRPHYALLLEQKEQGTTIQIIGPGIPATDAKRMLLEALAAIEQAQQGRAR